MKIQTRAQQLQVIFCDILEQIVLKITYFSILPTASTSSTVSFSDVHDNIGLFANNFDIEFPENAFFQKEGSVNQITSISETSKSQIKKLVEKTRANVSQLGVHLKVLDPSKMLNILVIAQQLNIIDPPQIAIDVDTPITVKDVLTVPTTARTKKRIRKKLSYGVMSDVEIVNSVDAIIASEIEEEKRNENDRLVNIERSEDIESLESNIQEMQSGLAQKKIALKQLKDTRTAEKKAATKRKATAATEKKARNGKQFISNTNASDDSNAKPARRVKKN